MHFASPDRIRYNTIVPQNVAFRNTATRGRDEIVQTSRTVVLARCTRRERVTPATAAGQTKLQPAYAENTVLPTGDYVVDASGLTVPDGIKLTISAGSTIFIPSDVGITVIGQLEVLGNRDAKVVFLKQSNSGSLAWKGIEVKSAGSLTLKFAVLRGGNKCVVSSGTLLVEDSEFNSCENGAIDHNTKLVTIRRSLFLGNAIANSGDVVLLQYPAPGASVTGSIFHGHATSATNVDTRGLAVVTSSDSNKVDDTIYVTNNTFARFDKSALLVNHAGLGTVVIVNNSFKYCGATGPVVAGIEVVQLISPQGKVVLTSNNFNSNNQPNLNAAADKVVKDNGYVNFAVEPTHRSENPQNLNDFYRLAAISPTIGKGTTSFLQSGDPLLDIDGDKRPLRDSYISVTTKGMDIGADEYKLPGPQINAPSIPAVGQGATVTVTLKGSNLPPDAIVTVWFGQTKLNVQNDPWSSTDSFSFKVSVPEDAATLRYNLTFASDEGSVTFNEVFNVVPGPKVTSVTPDKLGQGVSQVSVTLKGTDFSTSVSVTSASGGVTVDSVTRKDASTVNVVLSVGDNTPEGNVVLNVVNTDDGGRTTTAIQVQARPQITSVTPDEIRRGTTADLQLVGQAFQSGLVCSIDGDGVTIDGTVRESETNAKVSVTLTANATLGERQLSLKNPDGGTATKTVFIRSNPALTSVTPATSPRARSK